MNFIPVGILLYYEIILLIFNKIIYTPLPLHIIAFIINLSPLVDADQKSALTVDDGGKKLRATVLALPIVLFATKIFPSLYEATVVAPGCNVKLPAPYLDDPGLNDVTPFIKGSLAV
jgi:hypothetical protein